MGIFKMPSLGADMEAGRLVEWMVKPGDAVHRGDVVAVVETQKGAIEIEIFQDGKVHEILADPGVELPVGAPLAVVLSAGEAPPETAPARTPRPVVADAAPPASPVAPEPAPPVVMPGRLEAEAAPRISPAARALAKRLGVDLANLQGSGPGGAILSTDVENASQVAPSKEHRTKASQMEEMRKAIAAAMVRSKQTIPHFYLSEAIDVDPAIQFLDQRNAGRPPDERVLLGAVFVRAAVLAASKVPVVNGHFLDETGFSPADAVNPGIAIALRGGGLTAPALIDAGAMSLDQIMVGMRDLVTRARAGRLRASEITEGTITISSLGETGAETMTGVIFPPQVALVGLGAPHLRPWVVDGEVVPRHVVTVTVSADHRVSDGRQVARFITEFAAAIEAPEDL